MDVGEVVFRIRSDGAERVQKQIEAARKAAEREADKLRKRESKDLDDRIKERDRIAEAYRRAYDERIRQEERLAKIQAANHRQQLANANQLIDRGAALFDRMSRLAALGAAGAIGAGVAGVKTFADDASQLKTRSEFTAMTTQQFQELAFVTEQNGMSAEKLADGIRQFNAGLREGAKSGGLGAVAEAADDLGIGFKNLIKMRPTEQLETVLKRLNEVGPSAGRGGIAAKLFGEMAGAGFARVADEGVPRLEELKRQAHELGFVLSDEAVEAGVKLKQEFGALSGAATGLKNSISIELLPIVSEIVTSIRDWIAANRTMIATGFREWLSETAESARELMPQIIELSKELFKLVPLMIEWGPALVQSAAGLKGLQIARDVGVGVKSLGLALAGAATGAASLSAGLGGIVTMLVTLIPLALKAGDALGDLDNQDTGPRASLAQKLIASQINSFGIAGADAFTDQLAAMSPEDRAAVKREVMSSERARDPRVRGKFESLFFQARKRQDDQPVDASDTKELTDALAKSLSQYSRKELRSLLSQGLLTEDQVRMELGHRGSRDFFNKRKGAGDKEKQISDLELAKIIQSAVDSGQNLDKLIGHRKIAGDAPPVITVQVHNNNFNIQAPIAIHVPEGTSVQGVTNATQRMVTQVLGQEIARLPPIREKR
jgi:hypothetical protein